MFGGRGRGLGPEIVDFGPLPGPTRPRGRPGKGPGRGPARFAPIFSPVDQFQGHSVRFFEPPCDCCGATGQSPAKSSMLEAFVLLHPSAQRPLTGARQWCGPDASKSWCGLWPVRDQYGLDLARCRSYQRDPEVFFWPSGFLESWGAEAKKPPAFGGKANKPLCS